MYRHIRQALVALAILVLAASLVPAGSAKRFGPGYAATPDRAPASVTTCHQYCKASSRISRRPVIVRTELIATRVGFRWPDAAIGFSVACGAMLVAAGAVVSFRARRSRRREVEAAA